MKPKILFQGAEADIILYKRKNWIFKDRKPKHYRIGELDDKIRKRRTKAEIKLLEKASKVISVPKLIFKDSHDEFRITMEFIEGKKISDELENFSKKQQIKIFRKIGENIAKLHISGIIHGDLTTSNIIVVEKTKNLPTHAIAHRHRETGNIRSQIDKNTNNKKSQQISLEKLRTERLTSERSEPIIYIIDFGLGFFSTKTEDKAVDLHLLKQALEAKHFGNWKKLFESVLKGYKFSKESKKVFERFKKVESRGRYKEQY